MPKGLSSQWQRDTVTVGILPSASTQDERDGDPTTSGHSSLLSPGKVDRPVMRGLVGVKNDAPSGWEGREYVLEINGFKGHPVMGSKLYSMGVPTVGITCGQKLLYIR